MSQENQGNKPKLNIEQSEEVAPGVYSNLAMVTHSQTEFILDFIQVMPGTPKAKVRSRVVLSPQHAKRVMKMLVDNISKFEGQHGRIEMTTQSEPSFPVNFGGPTGEA